MRQVWVRLLIAVVVVGLAVPIVQSAPVQAKGADSCPEPNDSFQQACTLQSASEATGYIFHSGDADAYRILSEDFQLPVKLELLEAPHPYRIELADWTGTVIASSEGQVLETVVPAPGAYYAFVWSPGGDASDDQPYRLRLRFQFHHGSTKPFIFDSQDFGGSDRRQSTPLGDYEFANGRLTAVMKPSAAPAFMPVEDMFKIQLTRNFMLTYDVRRLAGSDDALCVLRFQEIQTGSSTTALLFSFNPATGAVRIARVTTGQPDVELGSLQATKLNPPEGVNRVTLNVIERGIHVAVNGELMGPVLIDAPEAGRMAFGVYGGGQQPPTFVLDNLLRNANSWWKEIPYIR